MNKPSIVPRSCTDLFCCILFVLFWGVFAYGAIYGFEYGDINKLARTFDADNKPCGMGDREGYPYLYIKDLNGDIFSNNVCVSKCPAAEGEPLDCFANSKTACEDVKVYASHGVANRLCLPEVKEKADELLSKMNVGKVEELATDVKNAWPYLIGAVVVAFLIGYLYTWILEVFAGFITLIMIIGSLAGIALLGVIFFMKGMETMPDSNANMNAHINNFSENPNKHLIYFAFGLWGLDVILAIVLLCLCQKIKVAVKVIKLTADFVTDVPAVIFVPLVMTVATIVGISAWSYSFGYLASTGEIGASTGYLIGSIEWDTKQKVLLGQSLFSLFWGFAFLSNLTVFIIIYCACEWYYDPDQDNMDSPVLESFFKSIFFHTGSIAFASLIFALFWIIQLLMAAIYRIVRGSENEKPNIIQLILSKLCYFCVFCFEKIFKFISKHAFTEVILDSQNFCGSAKDAYGIISVNIMRFAILNGLIEIFNLLASICMASVVTIVSFLVMNYVGGGDNNYLDFTGPLLVVFLIGLVISFFFTAVYDSGANAIMYCYFKGGKTKNSTQKRLDNIFNRNENNLADDSF